MLRARGYSRRAGASGLLANVGIQAERLLQARGGKRIEARNCESFQNRSLGTLLKNPAKSLDAGK